MMTIADIEKLVRSNIRSLKPYSSARDEYVSDGSDKIFLDANENPYGNGLNRYPDPQQRALKAVISDKRGISQENLLLGNGSDEVLDLIIRAFCEPNEDNIITAPPTYGMYGVLAGINSVDNREVLLKPGFELDVDSILDAADGNTKLVFLCSPNNPTGNRFELADIKRILENFKGILVLDEAYIDFCKGESWLQRTLDYPNLIVTQTLSKAYGMAGIRLGICCASGFIIEVLNRIKPPYNVNELTQQAAIKVLLDEKSVQDEVDVILEQKTWLAAQLDQLDFVIEVFDSEANFILIRVDDAIKRYKQILDNNIVVRNRSSLPLCVNTLRFTVGSVEENLQLVKVLKSI